MPCASAHNECLVPLPRAASFCWEEPRWLIRLEILERKVSTIRAPAKNDDAQLRL